VRIHGDVARLAQGLCSRAFFAVSGCLPPCRALIERRIGASALPFRLFIHSKMQTSTTASLLSRSIFPIGYFRTFVHSGFLANLAYIVLVLLFTPFYMSFWAKLREFVSSN
jgi:hypothetical protein